MKKSFLLILLCSIMGTIALATKNNPKITAKPERCCPNGECIKKPQVRRPNVQATQKSSPQVNNTSKQKTY